MTTDSAAKDSRPPDAFLPAASWSNLQLRARVLQRLRAFFDARGFVEVETPLLSHDTVIDQHLDPIPVTLFNDPRDVATGPTLYLQTSPEFGMKRLLAAGEAQAIYQITRAFRGGEQGSQHNPEFTILEWYRVGDDYRAGMTLLAELASTMFETPTVNAITYRDAFVQFAGLDPHTSSLDELRCAVSDPSLPRDECLNLLLDRHVMRNLGLVEPTILYDYPASQAALARTRNDAGVELAERFELFFRGVELANGYHELLDADVLQTRNTQNNAARAAAGKYTLPENSRLLAAMRHGLPACSGCALGVDRLMMLLAGASNLAQVLAFPIESA